MFSASFVIVIAVGLTEESNQNLFKHFLFLVFVHFIF